MLQWVAVNATLTDLPALGSARLGEPTASRPLNSPRPPPCPPATQTSEEKVRMKRCFCEYGWKWKVAAQCNSLRLSQWDYTACNPTHTQVDTESSKQLCGSDFFLTRLESRLADGHSSRWTVWWWFINSMKWINIFLTIIRARHHGAEQLSSPWAKLPPRAPRTWNNLSGFVQLSQYSSSYVWQLLLFTNCL